MGKVALSRESHQYLNPPLLTKKARAFFSMWGSYCEFGMQGDEKNLGYLHVYEKLLGGPLSPSIMVIVYPCIYDISTNLDLPFVRLIIRSYPLLFMQCYAYDTFYPAHSTELDIISIFLPEISPSILETQLCNTRHHRGAKPQNQVQSHPAACMYCTFLNARDRPSPPNSSSSSTVRMLVTICQLPNLFLTSPTNEHHSTFSNLMEVCMSMWRAMRAKAHLSM